MFIVTLKFAANKAAAPTHMQGHKDWIAKGFDDGVFLMTGSLVPAGGGMVMARDCTREELEKRIAADPFVAENVVEAEITEVTPSRLHDGLALLG